VTALDEELRRLYGRPDASATHLEADIFARYAGRDDVFRAALEHAVDYVIYADAFGFLTDTVLVEIPFRHTAVWAEIGPPHARWEYDEGWFGCGTDAKFPERERRARWIFRLLPKYDHFTGRDPWTGTREQANAGDVERAYDVWITELGAPTRDQVEAMWRESTCSCADATFALWALFFLDAPDALRRLLDDVAAHPAAAVRSSAELVREAQWGNASDWLLDHVRAQRSAFLERAGLNAVQPEPLDPKAAFLAERLGCPLPARIRPDRALTSSSGGWTLNADTHSGLTAAEAIAVLDAAGAAEIVGLRVDGRGDAMSILAAAASRPAFARVRRIEAAIASLGQLAQPLARSRFTDSLRAISCRNVVAHDLEVLGEGRFHLESLRFSGSGPIGPEGFAVLASREAFAELSELELPSPHCKDEGIETWVACGRTRHLRFLALPNGYSGACVDAMRESGAFSLLASELEHLEYLDLADHDFGDAPVVALAENLSLGELRSLRLEGCGVTEVGVRALAASPRMHRLGILDLARTNLGPAGALAIAESPFLRKLFKLRAFAIGDDGAVALAGAEFSQLRLLDLDRSNIGDRGASALAMAPWFANVQILQLGGSTIGPDGAHAIATSPHALALQHVTMDGNPIGESGVRALLGLPELRALDAYGCGVAPSAKASLEAFRPDVAVNVG
jgi:hypothetical protein